MLRHIVKWVVSRSVARHMSVVRGTMQRGGSASVAGTAVVALLVSFSPIVVSQGLAQGIGQAPSANPAGQQQQVLRFVTEAGFPPFNFYDEDGILTGFNVDLARAICLELVMRCDIQVRTWDTLIPALQRGEAQAVIAAHAVTAESVAKVTFTDPYFRTPGRFATRRDTSQYAATPEGLAGRRIGIVKGTAHEAFIRRFFRGSVIEPFKDADAARDALKDRQIDALFDDAITMAFWLNGTLSQQCCTFRGGPYLEPRFFGDGIAIAVRKGDAKRRAQLNSALLAVRKSGRFQELVSRYFPFQIY